MSPKPLKPKKSRFIYIALLGSLLLHLGLVATPLLRAPAPEPEALKPVSITLNEYQLAPTTPAPAAEPSTQPAPKPKVMHQPQAPEAATAAPKKTTVTQPDVDDVPEADTPTTPTPEQDADATTPDEATANDTRTPDPEPESEPEQPLPADTTPKFSPGPKLSEKDIALNDNIIQPKSGKPSFPKVAKLRYEGPAGTTGNMTFERNGDRYRVTTQFNLLFLKAVFETTGIIDGKYFKPLHYTDTRRGKIYAQALFDYDNKAIHYGKGAEPDKTEPLTHRAQDYFTLAWQMALNGGKLNETMQLTNGKKVYVYSQFSPSGDRQYDSNEGKINVQVFRINKGEDSIEFAFAPDFANIPAQIILTDGGKTHQLRLIGINLDGVDYWQAMRRTGNRKNN